MNIKVGFLLLLCELWRITIALDAGESCTSSSGSPGKCLFLTQCPDALNQIHSGNFPVVCGYEGTQVIVCCTRPPTTRPTPTTPSRSPPVQTSNRVGDLSIKKCKEYGQYAYEVTTSILGIRPPRPILECPFEKEKLIVGGTKASRQEFPHMAQVGYVQGTETLWLCGGTIISPNFVLTAGHCLSSKNYGVPKTIRVGITNQTDTNHAQIRKVAEIIKHPDYNFAKYNDIGLLRMDRDFEMNIYVRPACLYTQKTFPVENAIASGWGKQEYAGEGSRDLLKVVLEKFSADSCNVTFRKEINQPDSDLYRGIVDDVMICYGSRTALKDTCQGDSGGPLQIYHTDAEDIKCMYWIIGVTSFGKACGLATNLPGVYTRVSSYVGWIENKVWR